jgi:hypothetical protein
MRCSLCRADDERVHEVELPNSSSCLYRRCTDFKNFISSNTTQGGLLQEWEVRVAALHSWAHTILARIDCSFTTTMVTSNDLYAQVKELRRDFPKFLKEYKNDRTRVVLSVCDANPGSELYETFCSLKSGSSDIMGIMFHGTCHDCIGPICRNGMNWGSSFTALIMPWAVVYIKKTTVSKKSKCLQWLCSSKTHINS